MDFAELERACEEFCERVNAREHRVTRRAPAVMLAEERERLNPLPEVPHTVCFGQTRRVSWQSTISVGGALYSVPSALVDERVWARVGGLGARRRARRLAAGAARGRPPRS